MCSDEYFMARALEEAEKAYAKGEVPVGCVIVEKGEIISATHNSRETSQNALCHAEIIAINEACAKIKYWRLCDCELFVTLEPCPMCFGAVINSRIKRVVFGASDKKAGVLGGVLDLNVYPFNHTPEVRSGVLAEECGNILSRFFSELRKKKYKI